jgi:hypothetical protein
VKVPELAESSAAAAGVAIIEGEIELETDGEAPFAGKCVGVPGLGEELVALPGAPPRDGLPEGIAEGSGTLESPYEQKNNKQKLQNRFKRCLRLEILQLQVTLCAKLIDCNHFIT